MKNAYVEVNVIRGWETWIVEVPDDADEDWVRDNLWGEECGEKWLKDSGGDGYEIESVQIA